MGEEEGEGVGGGGGGRERDEGGGGEVPPLRHRFGSTHPSKSRWKREGRKGEEGRGVGRKAEGVGGG